VGIYVVAEYKHYYRNNVTGELFILEIEQKKIWAIYYHGDTLTKYHDGYLLTEYL
jgi:hypothetical protein